MSTRLQNDITLRAGLSDMTIDEVRDRIDVLENMPDIKRFTLTDAQHKAIKTNFKNVLENTMKSFEVAGVTLAFYQNVIDVDISDISWGNIKFIQNVLTSTMHKTKAEAADIYTVLTEIAPINIEIAGLENELYHASEVLVTKETAENQGLDVRKTTVEDDSDPIEDAVKPAKEQ